MTKPFPDQRYPRASAYYAAYVDELERAAKAVDGDALDRALAILEGVLGARNTLYVCGNGGSAADAQHIAAELVGRYLEERPPVRALALGDNQAILTAWSNDYDYDSVFARQVEAHGEPGGVLWALSTSGNSPSVVQALHTARRIGLTTICMTGAGGGACATSSPRASPDSRLATCASGTPEACRSLTRRSASRCSRV